MRIAPALLEDWLRDRYFSCEFDLSSSGVWTRSLGDLEKAGAADLARLEELELRDADSYGEAPLREEIARHLGATAADVLVTNGSSEAIFVAMNAVLSPGDEVVCLTPAYHSLMSIPRALGCRLVEWPMPRTAAGFEPDLAGLRAVTSSRTKMVIANFPNNPTGATIHEGQLDELVGLCSDVGAWLLWDAAFDRLALDGEMLPSPTSKYERALAVGTLSKAYGTPGLRIGWLVGGQAVLREAVVLRDAMSLNVSPLLQHLATGVLATGDAFLASVLPVVRENRSLVTAWAAARPEVSWLVPRGGVCGILDLVGRRDSQAFCDAAFARGALVAPGEAFGLPGTARLGFGVPRAELEAGLERLGEVAGA